MNINILRYSLFGIAGGQAVKIDNAVRSRLLNSRQFRRSLCENMDSQHDHLLLHTKIRWLSRGKVLFHLFKLREETKLFLKEINYLMSEFLLDKAWLRNLAKLGDIFGRFHELDISL